MDEWMNGGREGGRGWGEGDYRSGGWRCVRLTMQHHDVVCTNSYEDDDGDEISELDRAHL